MAATSGAMAHERMLKTLTLGTSTKIVLLYAVSAPATVATILRGGSGPGAPSGVSGVTRDDGCDLVGQPESRARVALCAINT